MKGTGRIEAERRRQIGAEGYDAAHDDDHDDGSLLVAAFCYLVDLLGASRAEAPSLWPWEPEAWKPTPDDPERQMVKAGALIAAELDRRARAGETTP